MSHYAYKINTPLNETSSAFRSPNYLSQRFTPATDSYKHLFLVGLKEISSKLFFFHAHDLNHNLRCGFPLAVHEVLTFNETSNILDSCLKPMLIANFPPVDSLSLFEKIHFEKTLYHNLISRFYLNVLESLFLLSNAQEAEGLILTFDPNYSDILDLYRNFFEIEMIAPSEDGELIQLIVSTGLEAYDNLMGYIEKYDQDFQQMLWREQSDNLSIRDYLKSYLLQYNS